MQGARVIIQRGAKSWRSLYKSYATSQVAQPIVESSGPKPQKEGKVNLDLEPIAQRLKDQIVDTSSAPDKIAEPFPEGQQKPLTPKISKLVDEISQLNLLEVAELSSALKKRLNLPDAPIMPIGGFVGGPAAPAEEEEEAQQKVVQTSFTVKLVKYDEKQKVPLIKELKNLLEGMNLVQAKKFVESAPAVVKSDIAKDEAEKLKEALAKVGAEVEIV